MANEFKIRKGLIIEGATGGTVVDVQGSLGQLFSVTDNLTGEIFAVADISGVPIMSINSNGKVGIGTTSGIFPLNVVNASTAYIFSETTGAATSSGYRWKTASSEFAWFSTSGTNALNLYDYVANATRMVISSAGALRLNAYGAGILISDGSGNITTYGGTTPPSGVGAAGRVAIWDNGTELGSDTELKWDFTNNRLGIGVATPLDRLHVNVGTDQNIAFNSINSLARISSYNDAQTLSKPLQINGSDLRFLTGSSEKMRITSTGQVGIGGIPQTTLASEITVEIGASGIIYSEKGASQYNSVNIGSNWYYDSTNSRVEYKNAVVPGATNYLQYQGYHSFRTAVAPSAANDPITWNDRMIILNNGNVGIGTTSPDAKLHIYGNASLSEMYLGENAADDKAGILKYAQGNGGGTGVITLSHYGNNSASASLAIKYGGNVGIGTTSPNHKLQVEGGSAESIINLTTTGYANGLDIIEGTDGHAALWLRENSYMHFATNSVERMRIDSSGNVGIGNTNPVSYGKFVVDGTGNLINANASSGAATFQLYEGGQGRFGIVTLNGSAGAKFTLAGTEYMRINSQGQMWLGGSFTGADIANGNTSYLNNLNAGGFSILHRNAGDAYVHFNAYYTSSSTYIAKYAGTGMISGFDPNTNNGYFISKAPSVAAGATQSFSNVMQIGYGTNNNVGIGVTGPTAKLQVAGNVVVGNSGTSRFTDTSAFPLQLNRGLNVDVFGANGCVLGFGTLKGTTYADGARVSGGLETNGTDGNFSIQTLGSSAYSTAITLNSVQAVRFDAYGAGTLVTDASGNITVSSGGGAGGPYLPLIGGTMSGTIATTATEAMRMKSGSAFISGYTSNGATRNGYMQITPGLLILDTEGGARTISLGLSTINRVGIGTTAPGSRLSTTTALNAAASGLSTTILGLNWEVAAGASSQGYVASFANTQTASANANAGVLIKVGSTDTTTRLLSVESGGVNRFEVRGDGNVGIGTTTPLAKLDIQGTQGQLFSVTDDLSGEIFAVADISGVPIMKINSNNTISFASLSTISAFNIGSEQIINTTSIDSNTFDAGASFRCVPGSKGAPAYTFTSDLDTGMFRDGANTLAFTAGGGQMITMTSSAIGFGGPLTVPIGADISIGTSRINSSGDSFFLGGEVGIGTSSPDVTFHVTASEDGSGIDKGTAKFINTNTGQGATTMHVVQTSSSNFANAVKFWQGSTPTAVGFIRLTTSATQFITSASDLNLKKNITKWDDNTLDKFKALQPKKFRFKTQEASEDKTLGFIAQNEVNNFPEAYPQFLGDDEKPYYGFNPSGMTTHLMKAIKDLVEKVEILENKITQLEN